jgi:carbon storage regulator CsrA
MLVLKRKNRESVVVGACDAPENILKITILDIRRGKVTLGIEGDRGVPVYRCELWERVCASATPRQAQHCR